MIGLTPNEAETLLLSGGAVLVCLFVLAVVVGPWALWAWLLGMWNKPKSE